MKYNRLGKTDVHISEIGFGCMSLEPGKKENQRLLDRAVDLGINYFDTADLYDKGENESSLGRMLRSKRKAMVLATKVGNEWRPDSSGWDWNPGKAYILSAVEASLRRLQTDYIDFYQLHGGTMDDPIDETIEAFELLVRQGKIRHYGISSIRPQVIREYLQRSGISGVMMQYSLLDRRPEETVTELLQKNQVSLLARGALAKGLLGGKDAASFLNYDKPAVEKAAAAIRLISHEERTAAQTAIRYVLQQPAVAAAVVGIRTIGQCEEAVGASTAPALDTREISLLNESIPANRYEEHR